MRRKLLDLFAMPLVLAMAVLAMAAPADEKQARCSVAGTVFGTDILVGTLLVKDATGYIEDVNSSSKTVFVKLPVTAGNSPVKITARQVNIGDLVCVHAEGSGPSAQISVVSRSELQGAQRDFLVEWQRKSVYGTIWSLDIPARTFVVAPAPPSMDQLPVTISLAPSAELRTAPITARHLSDATSFRLEELQVGEPVYVRGIRAGAEPAISASLVLKGGYRAILGTLIEVQALTPLLKIREFGTGRTLSMSLPGAEVYRTTENMTHPMRVETRSGVLLAPVGYADLEKGDAILVIGRTKDQTSEGEGLIAVTKFGTFGVAPQASEDRITWFIR